MIKIILISVACIFANTFECLSTDPKECELAIAKHECEQTKIHVWSSANTQNNTLVAEEIKTESVCNNLGIQIQSATIKDNSISYVYEVANGQVQNINASKVTAYAVGALKKNFHLDGIRRPDSSLNISGGINYNFDSKDLQKKIKIAKQKAILKLISMLEEE